MRVVLIVVIILLSNNVLAKHIDIGKEKLDCPEDMVTQCTQESCEETLVYCPESIVLNDNGQWIRQPKEDCNTTTCRWKCYCVPKKGKVLYEFWYHQNLKDGSWGGVTDG